MDGGDGRLLDASGNSHVFPSIAGRVTGMVPLVFTNSSKKAKSPPEVNFRASEAEKKRSREMNWIREKAAIHVEGSILPLTAQTARVSLGVMAITA